MVLVVECGVSFTPDVTGPMSCKISSVHRILSQTSWGSWVDVFGKYEMSLCEVFFGQQCNSPIDAIFAQCVSYHGILYIDLES